MLVRGPPSPRAPGQWLLLRLLFPSTLTLSFLLQLVGSSCWLEAVSDTEIFWGPSRIHRYIPTSGH